ncbi:MAG: translation initiation factor IF-2 [Hyphomonadaceae bacterium]|nr:translation initiation factor IF-2 [Hyphomonadaceae bacterium]MBP9233210.1 translation initiation factor IF-2 [Hyphomonadaceae bacterium]
MSDTKDTDNTGRRPLTLKRADSGTVKQSFSHGRSKQVVVETKKKRVVVVTPGDKPKVVKPAEPEKVAEAPPKLTAAQEALQKSGLSEQELKARQAAIAQRRADEERRKIEQEALDEANKRRAEEARRLADEEKRRIEATARGEVAPPVEEEDRGARGRGDRGAERDTGFRRGPGGAPPRTSAGAPPRGPGGAVRVRPDAGPRGPGAPRPGGPGGDRPRPGAPGGDRGAARPGGPPGRPGGPRPLAPLDPDELTPLSELGGRVKRVKSSGDEPTGEARPVRKDEPKRRQGRLTISAALGDDEDKQRSYAAVKRARERERERRLKMAGGGAEKVAREVILPESITVADLANRMSERQADVVKFMMQQGELVRSTDVLDADTAQLIVEEFGHTVKRVAESDVEIGLEGHDDHDDHLDPRPPVVTVMGHVDHGKTSLLDALRQTDVVSGEAGGITQHIGAYQVQLKSGEKITFLDTPGHAAFSSMRARGANATDIVILVVAADDGVMPQTIEAIQHAKAAGAPIIVAVNKIDKHDADPNKVLTQLLQYDVQVEAMGGQTPAVQVSALKKTGLDELTATISALAEILELKANPDRDADGVVIESKLDKGRGSVATVLVNRGTLKRGDIVVAGAQWGRVKALNNERGQTLETAGPATPVEILGLDGSPDPGDAFVVVDSEARAREIIDYRVRTKRNKSGAGMRTSLDQMLARLKEGGSATGGQLKEAAFILKGDVQGSVEAITQALEKLSTDEVRARVVLGAVGGISESDVQLAAGANAPIIAFNVRANKQARDLAEREGVEIRYYSIIYNLIDDVKGVLSGMLAPERRETFLGYAEILQVFSISKAGKVAGCRVTEGIVRRGSGVRLLRDNVVIHEGTLSTLKRFKDEVPEVKQGMECGMAFLNYQDIREGDQIECFQVELIERKLD